MEKDFKKVIADIKSNYDHLEQSIIHQLNMANRLHGTTTGTMRETIWKELFERIIPKKFVIHQSVFIIDSKMNISKEVDLAIVDEMYTPFIFQNGNLKFIPIEAVVVVVECKSKSQSVDDLNKWINKIENLRTESQSIARLAVNIPKEAPPTQKSTRPIRILCHINKKDERNLIGKFDIILSATDLEAEKKNDMKKDKKKQNTNEIVVSYAKRMKTLYDWFKELNFYENEDFENIKIIKGLENLKGSSVASYKVTDSNLLSFNFQLNQLLMLINNPMPFPHLAYAEMFNSEKLDEKE